MHPKPPLPAESNNEVVEVAESDDDDSGFSSDMLQLMDTNIGDRPCPEVVFAFWAYPSSWVGILGRCHRGLWALQDERLPLSRRQLKT